MQKYDHQPNQLSKSRKEVMLKIRCNLVKNPYDTGGRILATEAKNVFRKNVLHEKKWIYSCLEYIKVPRWIRKMPIMTYFPLIWAITCVLRGIAIYSYDIYTDVEVIEDIKVTNDDFSIPDVSQFDENFTVSIGLIKNGVKYDGASIFRKPCRPIQDVENLLRAAPIGYNQFFYDWGNVRLLRDNDSFLDASDVTDFLANILDVTENVKSLSNGNGEGILPLKNLPKKINNILDELGKKLPTTNLGTWITGHNSDINLANKHLSNVKSIWTDIENRIVDHPLAQNIIRKVDTFWEKRKGLYPQITRPFIDFLRDTSRKLSKAYLNTESKLDSLPQPDPYNETENFNETQLFCRKYLNEVLHLFQCNDNNCKGQKHKKTLRETALKIFATGDHDSSFDNAAKSLRRNTKISTNFVFTCIYLYLIFLLGATIARECYSCFMDMWRYNIIPIATNVDLMKMQLTKTSKMFSKAEMNNRDVLVNAVRFDSNISEATRETLRAVCIQIALFMYLDTIIFASQDVWSAAVRHSNVTNPSNYAMSFDKFNLTEASVEFRKSPIFSSFISGVLSVAFAQFQMYSVRHGGDLEMMGKLVYFTACLLNTACIFLSMTMYYSLGLPNFIMILIVIIRRVCGFNDEDKFISLPDSNEFIMEIMIIAFALLPLIFLPKALAYLLHIKTNSFIMNEKIHRSAGIQSGYDVPGLHHGLFMFLPQSYFDYRDPRTVYINSFNRNPLSRKFYRLRFKLHLWNKTFVHFSSLLFGATSLHALDYLTTKSALFEAGSRFMVLRVPIVKVAGKNYNHLESRIFISTLHNVK